jgi:hypothetical protein
MSEKEYVVKASELDDLRENASVAGAIKELASILSGRADDLPHRFRAPSSLRQFFTDYGVNQSYYQMMQLMTSNAAEPLQLQFTTRPTQNILEIVFQGPAGDRLFTLEIEYGE